MEIKHVMDFTELLLIDPNEHADDLLCVEVTSCKGDNPFKPTRTIYIPILKID